MNRTRIQLAIAVLFAIFVAGCSNYYKIHDPTTGKDYFTEDYDQSREGSVTFIDSRTGHEVSIQNSEIEELDDEDDFEEGIETAEEAEKAAQSTQTTVTP